jgi:peptidoglycan/xylan/chitin deacetylase (PgdA/CDA1 family)
MSGELVQVCMHNLPARASWAAGLTVRVPTALAPWFERADAAWDDEGLVTEAGKAAEHLRLCAAFTETPPASSRLPISYRIIPAAMRQLIAAAIGRLQRAREHAWSRFPGWPLDLSSDLAADLSGAPTIKFNQTPALLTHDIDSAEGLANLLRWFLPAEEAVGVRSTNYVVPWAWPLDSGMLAEIIARGHEIGVHGYDHANKTPFASREERRRRLEAGCVFGNRYAASGYRAPSLLRTRALLADLALLYRYDASIPTSGGPFPVPNNGCASARPWQIGSLWEIPLTLPRDGSLLFLGHDAKAIGQLWRDSAVTISCSGGIVSLLTHCERRFSGNPVMLGTYRNFLDWLANDGRFEFTRSDQLVRRLLAADVSKVASRQQSQG